MKPITEKMTKPANILVALLVHVTINVSLKRKHKKPRHLAVIHARESFVHISGISLMSTHSLWER